MGDFCPNSLAPIDNFLTVTFHTLFMEHPVKPFLGTIPFDILDELFYLIAEEENLDETSLVCPRWRYLSQRELFAEVRVDPMLSHGICQVATPTHAHLAPYIKKVQVLNISWAKTNHRLASQCSPQFIDFVRALPAPEALDFRHPHLEWSNDTVGTFLEVFSRPSFRVLEVSDGKRFPIPLFLHNTNVDTLVMMDTKNLACLSHAESANLLETRLTSLSLLDSGTITTFAAFFRQNTALTQSFCQNLTRLTLKYVECCVFSSFSSDTITEILCTVGASVESLEVEAYWPCTFGTSSVISTTNGTAFLSVAEPARSLDFHGLVNVRHLHLSFTVPIPRRQDDLITNHVVPIITSLPMPQRLTEFSIALNYCTQGFPTIDDCDQPFEILGSLIGPIFMDTSKWVELKRVRVCLQLSRGIDPPTQTRPVPLPMLASQDICVEAFTRA